MNKIGDKSGSIGWGQQPSKSKSASSTTGDHAFKRALDSGSKPARENVQQQGFSLSSHGFQSSGIEKTAPSAVYETTQVLSCAEFVQRFPEAKQSIQPIVDLNKHKQLPTIALVSSSDHQDDGSIERIGNTIFISRNADMAMQNMQLDDALLTGIVGAIGQCIGSN